MVDVSVSTNSPQQGKQVTFTITVTNLGPDDASGVMVWAYFGDEKIKKLVGDVPAGETKEVDIEWFPSAEGPIQVRIVLNPLEEDDPLFETSRDNNDWVKPMRVTSPEGDSILETWGIYLLLILIVVVVIILLSLYGGGGGLTEGVEVVEEPEEGEDEEDDEDLSDDEDEYQDADDEGEGYDEDESEDGYDEDDENEEDRAEEPDMVFAGGRM